MYEPQSSSICNRVVQLPLSAGVLDDMPSWQYGRKISLIARDETWKAKWLKWSWDTGLGPFLPRRGQQVAVWVRNSLSREIQAEIRKNEKKNYLFLLRISLLT